MHPSATASVHHRLLKALQSNGQGLITSVQRSPAVYRLISSAICEQPDTAEMRLPAPHLLFQVGRGMLHQLAHKRCRLPVLS